MVEIASAANLGLAGNSLAALKLTASAAGGGRNNERVAVNIANGNLIMQQQDEALTGRGPDLSLLRTYNSQGVTDYDNNDNWRIGFNRRVDNLAGTINSAGSTVMRVDADGAALTFSWDATLAAYVGKEGEGSYDTLRYDGANWTWTDSDHRVSETYDWDGSSGKLLTQADPDGNTVSHSYNSAGLLTRVQSASGESTWLDYNGLNLTQVRTTLADGSTSTRVRYGYDAANRLASVTLDLSPGDNSIADGKTYVTTYTYEGSSQRLSTLQQTDGTLLSFTYDASGRVTRIANALNETSNFSYDAASRITTVTDALGMQSLYAYDAAGRLTQLTAPSVGGVVLTRSFGYNANGDLVQVTDGENNSVVMSHDANGNVILQRDAAGNTVTRTYDAFGRLLTETTWLEPDPDGAGSASAGAPATTRDVYAAAGQSQARFIITPEGRVTEYRYNGLGQRTSSIEYAGNLYTAATATEADLVAWVNGAADRARSVRTDLSYDFRGQLAASTRYASVDAAGNGMAAGSATTSYVYSASGFLLQQTDPGSAPASTLYTYDGMGRPLATINSLNQTTLYQYDDAGRTITQVTANGLRTISTYDQAGRLQSVMQSDAANANLATTRYFNDTEGRLRLRQDPTGVRYWTIYDASGRMAAEIDGNGSMIEYRYNRNDQLTQTVRYANFASLAGLTVDVNGKPTASALALGVDQLRPVASSADQANWNAYDSAGRLVRQVDSQGSVTEIQYDGGGRLLTRIAGANAIGTAALGAQPSAAHIASTANAAQDRITRAVYDKDGLLKGMLDGEGYLTETLHDAAGQAWQTVRYATRLSGAVIAAVNASTLIADIRPVTSGAGSKTTTLRDASGQAVGVIDAENILTETTYDSNGNAVQVRSYATPVSAAAMAGLGSGSSLSSVRPAALASDQVSTTSYDALNRMTSTTDAEGTRTDYAYDAVGHLTSTTSAAGSAEARGNSLAYDLIGRITTETDARGKLTTSQYDAAGRLRSRSDANGNKTRYYYDVDGQLLAVINALGEVTGYTYNALQQKTAVTEYGTRIAATTLAGLNGGLLDAAASTALAGIANAAFDSTSQFSYNSDGSLATTTDALGNVSVFGYNSFGEQTQVSVPAASGSVTSVIGYDRRGLQTSLAMDPSGLNLVINTQYDAFGRVVGNTDARGGITTRSYDRLGREVQTIDAMNQARSTTYDAFGRVLSQTDALGHTTLTQYNDASRGMTVTTPEGIVVTTVHNRHGQTQSVTDGNGNVTTYNYDANGNLTGTSAPLGLATSLAYDDANRLIASTDSAGVRTVLTYDAANRVLSRTLDPDSAGYTGLKLTASYVHDARGRTIISVDPRGVATLSEFDRKGQLVRQTLDPTTILSTNDNPLGLNLLTQYSYDPSGMQLSVTDAAGTVTQFSYDRAGRRLSETVDPAGLNLRTSYAYDANDNLVSSTDANGNVTRNAYDANDRLTYSVDAVGAVTRYEYDAAGNLVRRTAYAATITPLASPESVLSSPGRDQLTRNFYDGDKRLTRSIDAMGAITDFSYDANGKLTSTRAYAQAVNLALNKTATQSSISSSGDPTRAVDGNTSNVYSNGSVTHTLSELNAWWQVDLGAVQDISTIEVYNRGDNLGARLSDFDVFVSATDLTGRSYSDILNDSSVARLHVDGEASIRTTLAAWATGRYVRVQLTGANPLSLAEVRVNGLTPQADATRDHLTTYDYDALGRQIRTNYPVTGVYQIESRTDLETNGANSVAARVDTSVALFTQTYYDAAGHVVATRDAAGNLSYQAWDRADRLLYAVDAEGYVTGYTYDAQGNVTQKTRYALKIGDSTRAAWGASAPSAATLASLLDTANSANRTTVMQYDAAGRTVQVTQPTVYSFDGNTAFSASPITKNTYNALGQVIRSDELQRDATWLTTRYYYDQRGLQTATVDALGYLSTQSYDAVGNLVQRTEYAAAATGIGNTSYTLPAAGAKDRTVSYTYDGNGRKLTETQVNAEYSKTSDVANGVTLYKDSSYAGVSQTLGVGLYNVADLNLGVGNDALSSLKVAAGWQVTLYQHGNFQGQTLSVTANAASLGTFNNIASSIAVSNGGTFGNLTSSFQYDAFGNLVKTTDAGNNSSYTWYDQDNRIRAVADPARQGASAGSTVIGLTEYTRDAFGNMTQQIDRADGAAAVSLDGYTMTSDANDRVSSNAYDNMGRKLESTDALGVKTYFSYDANGKLAKQWIGVAGNDGVTHTVYSAYRFDKLGRAVYSNEAGKELQMQYDAFGELTARGGKAGFDLFGTQALGWQETFDYDSNGRLWRTNAGDGVSKVMLYDLQGHVTGEIRSASVNLQGVASAAAANALTGTRRVENRYDALGRMVEQDMANNATFAQTWDRWGNRLSVSDARNASWKTEYTYNNNNQVTRETLPTLNVLGNDQASYADQRPVTDYSYDYAGNQIAVRDARGNLNRSSWDANGKLLTERNADGGVISHFYNAFGEEVRRVDARNNATTYEYDKNGRLVLITRPVADFYQIKAGSYDASASESQAPVTLYDNSSYGGAVSYFGAGTWDSLAKEVSSIKVRAGWKVTLYDDDSGWDGGAQNVTYTTSQSSLPSDLNDDVKKVQVSRVAGAEAQVELALQGATTVAMTYDALGRRLSTTNGGGTTANTYDLAGHLVAVTQPGAVTNASGYDSGGFKFYETNANGDVMSWGNDYFGRVTQHGNLDGGSTSYTYDYAGQLTREIHTGGRDVTTTYNSAGQVTRITDKVSGTTLRTTDYTYDLAGNRLTEKTTIGTTVYQNQSMTYDAIGRLTQAGDATNYVTYKYDLLGNRAKQTSVAAGVTTNAYYAYDAMNRMTLVDGVLNNAVQDSGNLTGAAGRRISYDLNGNRTGETAANYTQAYSYDALNRLTTTTHNGATLRYTKYDLADRVLESFDQSQASQTEAVHYTNIYDSAGRLVRQFHRAGSTISGNVITTGSDDSVTFNTYDTLGNLTRSVDQIYGAYAFLTTTNYTYAKKLDSVVQTVIAATRTDNTGNPGKTTLAYDLNGYLISITDEDKATNNRSFINNASGQVLQKTQQTSVLKNLVANGQVLGTYGTGVNQDKPAVVSKVKVQITMHVISQSDGATPTSEYDLTYTAGDKSSTTHYDDVDDGGEYALTLAGVTWPPAGGTLIVKLSGKEVDPAAADDALVTATLNIAASSWTTEGQGYTSATFTNGTATYYLKVKINADQSSPSYTDTVNNFNIAYQAVDAAHPGSGPGAYRVNAGDTLQSIALGAYGDRGLWYLIADANGLQANTPVQAGQMLTLPNTVGTVHNNAGTYRPYEAARIVGDTSPTLATPAGSSNTCQSVSIMIAAVVAAIVVTVLATAATVATLGVLGVPAMSMAGLAVSMIFAAAGGALASMASQGVMIAGGMQSRMNWSDVATGAVSGAATAGVGMAIGVASRAALQTARNSRLIAMASSATEQTGDDAVNAARAVANLQRAMPRVARMIERRSGTMVKILGASDETEKAAKVADGLVGGIKQKGLMQTRSRIVEAISGSVEGAASEILAQGMGQAMGQRDSFDWDQVALSALNPGTPMSGAKLNAMADAEIEVLRGANRSAMAAGPASTSMVKRLKLPDAYKVLKSTGLGFGMGFASGIVKSSIYQGINMATGNQQGFDTDAMLMMGYAGGVAGGANKGLVAVGERRVNGVTGKMDTRSFDWQRIGAATVGSVAATFTMHSNDLGAAQDSLAVAQRSLVFDANVLGYVRGGRAL